MDVSAQTLREVAFREKLRGYHPDDVDEFLERVAAGIEFLQDKLRQATERAQRAETRAAESNVGDDALKRTLLLAQRTAEMAVQEARQEAERISAGARAEANAIVAQAEEIARRTIEETQGGIRSELTQLETVRDHLRSDITALERHLDEQRVRLAASLSEALSAVEQHLAPAPPAPALEDPDVPPMRVPTIGPLPPLDPETIASFMPPEPAAAAADVPSAPFGIEIVQAAEPEPEPERKPEPQRAEPAPRPAPARVPSPPVFDELAPDAAFEPWAAPEPLVASEPAAPEPVPSMEIAQDQPIAQETPSVPVEEDEDPFIAELRRAITDTQPLGPRDEGDTPEGSGGEGLMHGDVLDGSRLGSLLRRRR